MRITAEMLRAKGACEERVATFEKEWPEGTELTLPVAMRALALGLDLSWFAAMFLRGPAWKEYLGAVAQAWAEYLAPALVAAWEMQSKEASDDN